MAGILIRFFLALLLATPASAQTGPRVGPLLRQFDLGDLNNTATARGNLGVDYGTTAGTVAQGNDSRIVGAFPASGFPSANLLGGTGGGVAGVTVGGGLALSGNVLSALVTSVAGRTGAITIQSSDITTALGGVPLLSAGNLAGLGNVATARTNLGLGTMATQNSNAVAITGGSVAALTTNGVLSFDSSAGATADLVELAVPLSWTNGQTTLTVGSSLSTTGTVSATQGANVLSITGSQPLTFATHQRNPIAVSLGNGATWSGIVLAVQNSGGNQTVTISTSAPATAAAVAGAAIVVGMQFTSADIGKTVAFSQAGGGVGSYGGTIAGVVSANVVTVSPAIGINPSSANPEFFWLGTDNYAALAAAVQAAVQTNALTLTVNGRYLVSKMPSSATRVRFVGGGQFQNVGGSDTSPPSYAMIPVVPPTAPTGIIADNQVPATVMARLSAQKGGTIRVAVVGASTATEDPGVTGWAGSWRGVLLRQLQAQNPTTAFKIKYFAQGGGTLCAYLSACTYPGGVGDWVASTGTPWIGGPWTPGYAYTFDGTPPDLVILEVSANDSAGSAQIAYLEALWAHFQLWATPPALIVVLDPNQSYAASNISQDWYRSWSRFLRGWGAIRNVGVVDYYRVLQQMRNGIDPARQVLERVPVTTATLNAFGGYIPTLYATEGYAVSFGYTGTQAGLWAAAGNLLTSYGGGTNDNANAELAGNAQWGLDGNDNYPGGTNGQLYLRGDLLRAEPGGALRGGTVPFVYGSLTLASGSNSLTYAPYANGPTSPFTSSNINGKIVTIPGAGSTSASTGTAATVRAHPVPAGGTYQGPLVAYAKYISGTNIQLFSDVGLTTPANAVTAVSAAAPAFVMLGSPRVYTGLVPAATGSVSTLSVWFQQD